MSAEAARPILLIGGTGRIGRHVAAGLVARGIRPRVLARDPDVAASALGGGVELRRGDLDDAASLMAAMEGAGAAYLASAVGPRLVEQHARAIDCARRAGVAHMVRVSTEGVEADGGMALSDWHRAGEAELERSGLAWTHLRPCNFMHNMLGFAPSIAARGEIRAPFGAGRMTLVDVGDIAAVAVACLLDDRHRGRAYRITGEDWLGYAGIAACVGTVIGREVRYVALSPDEARAEMGASGTPPWLIDDLLAMYAMLGQDRAAPVTEVVRVACGHAPRRFADFAREHAAAFASGDGRH